MRVKRDERVGVWWLDGVDVSVMAWCQTLCHCQWSATSTHPSTVSHSPVCFKAIVLSPAQSVCWCCVVPLFCPLSNPFSLTTGFGDDVVAEQPSHPCLEVHDSVCHVTPCVFLSSEPWLKQCAFKKCSLCLWSEWIHRKSICLCDNHPQWFHKSALKVHMIHCDSHAAFAPVCLL